MNRIKKVIVSLVILIIMILQIIPTPVEARAGGGSSGGGSSGGSSGSHGTAHSSSSTTDPISSIFGIITFAIIGSSSIIIMKIKITKYRYNARKDFKDTDWNYKELVKRAEKTYFVLQKAWTKNEINIAKDYLTKELYENYKSKLQWMEISNKKNILKKIKLLNVFPISVLDEIGDKNDKVYMYIKGKMIDYIINTKTNEVIEGNGMSSVFIEYWLFVKNKKGEWVLSKIYQCDELDTIPY